MTITYKKRSTRMEWLRADENILAHLRPGAPFNAGHRSKLLARQFGGSFAGVACCWELPGNFPPRWEGGTKQVSTIRLRNKPLFWLALMSHHRGRQLDESACEIINTSADAHEALGKEMQQEATQELIDEQGLELLLIVVSGIAPAKSDRAIGEED